MPDQDRVSFLSLFTPAFEQWRIMVGIPLLVALVTAGWVLLRPREWRASMALSTIVTARDMPLTGGISALLNAGSLGGLQATPALIVRLSTQYGVLYRTAHAQLPDGSTVRARLEALEGSIREADVVTRMGKLVSTSFDKQTGVITLEVESRDSALARFVALRLVDEVSETFIRSSKSQAREVREALEARVDSAGRALQREEERLRQFVAQNRRVPGFSEAHVDQQQLLRAVSIAQGTYSQAISAREDAVGRELEETPAVVVIDPVPERLVPVRRRLALKVGLAIILASVFTWLLLLARATVRESAGTDPETSRFLEAVARVPLLGRPALVILGMPRHPTPQPRRAA